jgi:hypothetical protein
MSSDDQQAAKQLDKEAAMGAVGGARVEEEGEEEYEEAEPVLAYSRMKNGFNDILATDSVSCMKAGTKVKS